MTATNEAVHAVASVRMGLPELRTDDNNSDAKIRSFVDQRVWPPLTWFDFALTPNLLETHLVAKENVSSGDGGREIISALLHAAINQAIKTRSGELACSPLRLLWYLASLPLIASELGSAA